MAVSGTGSSSGPMDYRRMTGLASGIDTEGMVKQLMKAESIPMNKLFQKKQSKQWERDALRTVNTKLLEFRQSMEKLRLQSTFNQTKLTSSDPTTVEMTKVGTPGQSSYSVTDVIMPVNGQPASTKFMTNITNTDGTIGQNLSFQINGTNISVASGDTISAAVDKINMYSSATGVKANYFEGDKSLTLVTTKMDATAQIDVTGVAGANPLGLGNGVISNGSNTFGASAQKAQAAIPGSVTINGTQHDISSTTFTYDNVKFTLKYPFNYPLVVQSDTTKDTDATFDAIKGFVDKYNELTRTLKDLIREKKYKDFQPLLDDQKTGMKDDEIKLWESKAKSGILRNNDILDSTLSSMRNSLFNDVKGVSDTAFDNLAEMGIKTSSDYSATDRKVNTQDDGRLILDETKLRSALNEHPDSVMDLFAKSFSTGVSTDTTANNSTKYEKSGLAWRLYDRLNVTMTNIAKAAGGSADVDDETSTLGKELKTLDSDIIDWKARLVEKENRYYKRFTALETAINKLNSQSSWLSQQFSQ